jgi:hypothetical protein
MTSPHGDIIGNGASVLNFGEVIHIGLVLLGALAVIAVFRRHFRSTNETNRTGMSASQRRFRKIERAQVIAVIMALAAIPGGILFNLIGLDTLVLAMGGLMLMGGAVFGILQFAKAFVDVEGPDGEGRWL